MTDSAAEKGRKRSPKLTVLGALIIGVILLTLYSLSLGKSSPGPAMSGALIEETLMVEKNDMKFYKVPLSAGAMVRGTFEETGGLCVNFYVLSEPDFQRLRAREENFSSYLTVHKVRGYVFNFTAPSDADYYFIFENNYLQRDPYCQEKYLIFRLYS